MATAAPPAAPPADRIRLGDVWLDIQGRKHLARPCVRQDLVLMEPLEDEIVPVAMDPRRPHPWQRITWGGE